MPFLAVPIGTRAGESGIRSHCSTVGKVVANVGDIEAKKT
jgi:hypothetical protein